MKPLNFIQILLFTILCAVQPVSIMADKTPAPVKLRMKKKMKKNVETEGHRVPPMPVWCDISKTDGVKISGLSEDIINYQIHDISTEECIVSFAEEPEFVDYVLSRTGDYLILLESDNYYIIGIMSTSVAELSGNWQLENITKTMGDGIELHLSGRYDFGNDGSVHAEYKTVTTMAAPTADDGEGKSVYLVLQLDGTGTYSITDGSLNIDLNTIKKNYYMGEGTYDNMGPAYNADNTQDAQLTQIWFSTLASMLTDRIKNVDIKAITLSNKTIEGSLMGNKVTLTRID